MAISGVQQGKQQFLDSRRNAQERNRKERFVLQEQQEYEELQQLFPPEKKKKDSAQDAMTAMEKLGASSGNAEIVQRGAKLKNLHTKGKKAPYFYLADDNHEITYNGVTFRCNNAKQRLELGDISNPDKVMTISLSGGGCLMVNRDNLDQLARAIGMFSPEDARRIMDAIAQDAKIQKMQAEIDEAVNGLGEESPSSGVSDD